MTASGIGAGRLHQVALGCSDLVRSIAFYRDRLGLALIESFDPPGLAFFQLGDTRLLLERSAAPRVGDATLYLAVPDIQTAYEALASVGVAFDSEPHRIHTDASGSFGPAGEEEWMAFFRDPDGNTLALASRIRSAT